MAATSSQSPSKIAKKLSSNNLGATTASVAAANNSREITSSQMTGRFSSPEHNNVFHGRNSRTGGGATGAGGGVPLSTASFKLNLHGGDSSSVIKSNDPEVDD